MIAMRRGLGATNVEAIAKALMGGQLHPSFQTVYYQPPYMPVGTQTQAPSWMYMDSSSASEMANLLGGSVFQAQNTDLPGAPPRNVIRLGDGGEVLPGNLLQPGTVLSFGDLCSAENYFANSIPGGELGSSCAGTPNALITGPGTTAPPIAAAPPPVPQTVHPQSVVAPVSPASPVPPSPLPPASSQVVTGTPGASPAAGGQTSTSTSGSWFTETSIGSIPNWMLLVAAGVAVFAFSSGGNR